jgi:hypothetical protein
VHALIRKAVNSPDPKYPQPTDRNIKFKNLNKPYHEGGIKEGRTIMNEKVKEITKGRRDGY